MAVPTLDQSRFVTFAEIVGNHEYDWLGNMFYPGMSLWQKGPVELAAGALATACFRAGEWKPINERDALAIALSNRDMSSHELAQGWLLLTQSGDIEIFTDEGVDWAVPKPSFAQKLKDSVSKRLFRCGGQATSAE